VRLAAVSRTAAFAFAGVFAFATVVTGLATAFAFAGVLSFAGMNVLFAVIGHLPERSSSFARGIGSVRLDGERTSHQAGYCCAREDGCWFHVVVFRFVYLHEPETPRECVEAGPGKRARENLVARMPIRRHVGIGRTTKIIIPLAKD